MKTMWEEIRQNVYIIKGESETTIPIMVFSVIGDSDSFVPRPWPTNVFQTALIEAAKSGGGRCFTVTSQRRQFRYHIFFIKVVILLAISYAPTYFSLYEKYHL